MCTVIIKFVVELKDQKGKTSILNEVNWYQKGEIGYLNYKDNFISGIL